MHLSLHVHVTLCLLRRLSKCESYHAPFAVGLYSTILVSGAFPIAQASTPDPDRCVARIWEATGEGRSSVLTGVKGPNVKEPSNEIVAVSIEGQFEEYHIL